MPVLWVMFQGFIASITASLLASLRLMLGGLLVMGISGLVRFALVYLGVGLVSYVGMDFFLNESLDFLQSRIDVLPPELFDILKFMGLLDFISIVTAAMTASVALKVTVGAARLTVNRNASAWKPPAGDL